MPSRSYVKGRAFEYRVKKDLQEKGYFVVRQPVSAFPDLVCLPPCLVECKTHREDFSREERARLAELGVAYRADCYLAYKNESHICYSVVFKMPS